MFHSLPLLHLKGYQPDFPIASSRCQQSSDIVSGFYFEKWARTITLRQVVTWVLPAQQNLDSHCFPLSYCERHLWLIYYQLYILTTTWGLILKNIWHVSVDITDTIGICLHCDRSFLWISEHNPPNKLRYFGYKNNLYGTKGTFIV